jgi:hypothetical protein
VQAWALHEQAAASEVANFDAFAAKISFEKILKVLSALFACFFAILSN